MMNEATIEDYNEALLEEYENVLQDLARQNEKLDAMKRWFETKGNLLLTREDFYVFTGIKTYTDTPVLNRNLTQEEMEKISGRNLNGEMKEAYVGDNVCDDR